MNPISSLNRCRSGPLLALSMLACVSIANAQVDSAAANQFYRGHALVSDGAIPADVTDPNLVNPWGVVFNPNAFVWVANNATGVSTLYDGAGKVQSLVVKIPPAKIGDGLGHPTGIVYNSSTDFAVSKGGVSGASAFLFAGEDGSISGWSPGVDLTNAIRAVDRSAQGVVYKGLALGGDGMKHLIYATDFHNGRVDVFDGQFTRVNRPGAFQDNDLPAGFAPFGIQNINGDIVVTYAKQDSAKHDNVKGAGLGIVDVFDAKGKLIRRVATRGALNAPWGLAMAPPSFGAFGGALLVGNFGDGTINAYDAVSGRMLGTLKDSSGKAIKYDGLWGISFGNGVDSQATNALYFAAGPDDESHGVYGVIRAASSP